MTTNTTQNVQQTHEHQFGAQGVCGCGITHDQWREQHEAGLAAQQPAASQSQPETTQSKDEE